MAEVLEWAGIVTMFIVINPIGWVIVGGVTVAIIRLQERSDR